MRKEEDYSKYYECGEEIADDLKYGKIYIGNVKNKKEMVKAIKIMDKNIIKDELRSELLKTEITDEDMEPFIKGFVNEAENMKIIQGEKKENINAVFIDEYFNTKDQFVIIMELCDCSLLKFYIEKENSKYFNSKKIREILIQLNNSFKIMNEKHIIHRALKLENILIKYKDEKKEEFIVKLKFTDESEILNESSNKLKDRIIYRNRKILAPEILKGEEYNEQSDLWSLGILIYYLFFGEFPYNSNNIKEILKKIKDREVLKKSKNYHLDDLISKLLVENPGDRITWKEYFNHPFFRKKESYLKYYKINKEKDRIAKIGFACIYKWEDKISHEKKAIKVFDKKNIISAYIGENGNLHIEEYMKKKIDSFFNEVNHLKILQGKDKDNNYTVIFEEYFNTESEFVIVMELCDDNLRNYCLSKNDPFSLEEIQEILSQLNNSFRIMVENEIIHRALRIENILIKYINKEKKEFIVKLKLTEDSITLKNLSNNPLSQEKIIRNMKILAPEILKEEKKEYDQKSDLWSLGVLIYILVFKKYPFNGESLNDLLENINNKEIEIKKEKNFDDLNNLIQRLLKKVPNDRISWEDYFKHPFFKVNHDYKTYYEIGEKIGEGGYGIIYKAKDKKTQEERAIKIMDKEQINNRLRRIHYREPKREDIEPYIKGFFNEVKNMKIILEGKNKQNKYACSIIEHFNTKDKFAIVMELCDDNLLNYLIKIKKIPFTDKEILKILTQLNESFKIMVDKEIIHRAIKLENILIKYTDIDKKEFIVKLKLTDDSISSKDPNNYLSIERILFNRKIMAPEILNEKEYDKESDLWSLGILIYVLAFKEYPYDGDSKEDILNKIKAKESTLKKTKNNNLNDLIKKLLIEDPEKRLTWKQYFNHKFFKE